MTGNAQNIIASLFHTNSLENVTTEDLQKITEEYPSFGAAHYLLSKKLQMENAVAFEEQSKKTALYFPNPFWLQSLFQQKKNNSENAELFTMPASISTATEENKPPQNEEEKNEIKEKVHSSQEETSTPPVKEEALIFEPYHTIDYFASQGIKFVLEENPKDKLGKQLKSFTDWLKVMKKLPQKNIISDDEEPDPEAIEAEAGHSVEGKEVVTEAMAEVLLKQGKVEEAAGVYHKLSLLYPDKSVYFAAKFEHLKVH